jgi:hypothetical protein
MTKIELDGREVAAIISALTVQISRLGEQHRMFKEDGQSVWAAEVAQQIEFTVGLKERLFK